MKIRVLLWNEVIVCISSTFDKFSILNTNVKKMLLKTGD